MIPTILLATDETDPARSEAARKNRLRLTELMFAEGWRVLSAGSPEQLRRRLSCGRALSLLVLDGSGTGKTTAFLLELRALTDLPILAITDRSDERGELEILNTGVDAFLHRPVSDEVVIAHIRNLLRRFRALPPREIVCGGLRVSNAEHVAEADGVPVGLTPKEFELLYYLMQNPNRALSRYQILHTAWGDGYSGDERTVDSHIKALRAKLGRHGAGIVTIRSVGYKFLWEEGRDAGTSA